MRWSRYLVAILVAVLLGGGTAYLLTNHAVPAPAHVEPSPTAPPTDPAPGTLDDTSPSPSPSPSASRSPSHRPAPRPGTTPSVPPSPSPSPSHVPLYQAPKGGLCKYVDFGPMKSIDTLSPDDKPEVVSGTKPGYPPGSPLYTCAGGVGNVGIRLMGVELYPDQYSAAKGYVETKATDAPSDSDPVRGVGDDAYGYYLGATTIYKVLVRSGNLVIQVVLQKAYPVAKTFKAATVATAASIVTRLPKA